MGGKANNCFICGYKRSRCLSSREKIAVKHPDANMSKHEKLNMKKQELRAIEYAI